MKKKSLTLPGLLAFAVLILAVACNNEKPVANNRIKETIASYNQCLIDCNAKETQCIADYDTAFKDAKRKLNGSWESCSHTRDPFGCYAQAIGRYNDTLTQIKERLELCLNETNACRAACGESLSALPNTK